MIFSVLLMLACAADDSSLGTRPAVVPAAPPAPGGPFARRAEDLSTSWSVALAAAVPSLTDAPACPDRDADGFPDAWACPTTPVDQADCNDGDAAITPATERFIRPSPFLMGSASTESGGDERPVHVVGLSGYCMEVAEHTDASGRPLEGITWEQAQATCAGAGLRLPTEAEWEKAARGGCELGADPARCDVEDLRAYPWGNAEAPTCANSNHQAFGASGPALCEARAHVASEAKNTSPYGLKDMSGNVWEYVADWYHLRLYASAAARQDPLGPRTGTQHVLRGGGWNTFSTNMRVSNRFVSVVAGSAVGMRCARGELRGAWDEVAPVAMVHLRGEVRAPGQSLAGATVNLAAFAEADVNVRTGMPDPGRSPVVEQAVAGESGEQLSFDFEVPQGERYRITAGMDAGKVPVQPVPGQQGFRARSGSGGFGQVESIVDASSDVAGLAITISASPPAPGARPPG